MSEASISMFVWQMLSSVAINVLFTSALVWLTKSWISERLKNSIKHEYDEKLETHKAQLKAQADIEAERLRAQLNIAATEHQVKFARLHEKRADVITEIYQLLVTAHLEASRFTSPVGFVGEPSKGAQYFTTMNAMAAFFQYFQRNKIFLHEALCSKLENFVQEMKKMVIGFGVYIQMDEQQFSGETSKKKLEEWIKASQYFENEVPGARAALERELREVIGAS